MFCLSLHVFRWTRTPSNGPTVAVGSVAFLIHIREVPSSNLSPETQGIVNLFIPFMQILEYYLKFSHGRFRLHNFLFTEHSIFRLIGA
jgi:hypothetical protein